MEIILSKSAEKEIDKLLNNSEYKNVRIMLKKDSIFEPAKLDLKADEKGEYDLLKEVNGYSFIINVELASEISSITISYGGLLSRDEFSIHADSIY